GPVQRRRLPAGAPQQPGNPNGNQSSGPAGDSAIPNAPPGKGVVDPKRQREIVENWGKKKKKERAQAMVEVTRTLPAQYREAIEIYLKRISSRSTEENNNK